MVNKNVMEMLDSTFCRAAQCAARINCLDSTKHLRTAGAELLRAVRCSLDEAIDALDPQAKPACRHTTSDAPPRAE